MLFEFIGYFSVWIRQLSFRPDATAPNSSPLRTVTLNMKVVSNHEHEMVSKLKFPGNESAPVDPGSAQCKVEY